MHWAGLLLTIGSGFDPLAPHLGKCSVDHGRRGPTRGPNVGDPSYRYVTGKKSPGHIEQLPSGSWRVKVYGGTDPLTGQEIRLRKTCKTERAAQIELGKLLEQASAGRQPETNATVAELMDKYAEVADWDLSTRKAYE